MDWKVGLDKYLTASPPDDGFDDWCEDVIFRIDEDLYNENEEWFIDNDGQCNKWLNKLFGIGKDTPEAAQIIERAFKLYRLNSEKI